MLLPAYATGFALGFSLILAIGAQNAFVLRQGLLRQHVLLVVLFCASADTQGSSHQRDAGKASSRTPTQKSTHPPSAMPQ
tara:strand:- start:66 stop:305 length:240 start_codon:yes stop_codon:yes gene_type:complete